MENKKEKASKVFKVIRLLKLRKLVLEEISAIYGIDYNMNISIFNLGQLRAVTPRNEINDIIDSLNMLRGGNYPKHFTIKEYEA